MKFNLKNNLILVNILVFFVIAGIGVGAKMYFDRNSSSVSSSNETISMPDTPTPEAIPDITTAPTLFPTVSSDVIPTPTPTQDNRCIISVSGVKYDVTSYRKQHPGGDIFKCGSDMTKAFYGQHNNSTLKKMDKYKIG